MGLFDAFRYDGKRALVVGGATGMGAAAAELVLDAGAEVVVMDRAEVSLPGVKAIPLDLADKASIDVGRRRVRRAGARPLLVRRCGRRNARHRAHQLHRPPPPHRPDARARPASPRLGHRHDLVGGRASAGRRTSTSILEFLDIADFDAATTWAQEHDRATYTWSKQVINAYVARQALPLLQRGIRINAILPGPTDTPLARANAETWLTLRRRLPRGRRASRRRRRSSRPTRSSSSAATPPPA